MPELPEVEVVKRGLEPVMVGQTIDTLTLNRPDLRFPIPENLKSALDGKKIRSLSRRGKYLLGFVEGGEGFVLHLGMSGRIKIYKPGDDIEVARHDHVIFTLKNGAKIS